MRITRSIHSRANLPALVQDPGAGERCRFPPEVPARLLTPSTTIMVHEVGEDEPTNSPERSPSSRMCRQLCRNIGEQNSKLRVARQAGNAITALDALLELVIRKRRVDDGFARHANLGRQIARSFHSAKLMAYDDLRRQIPLTKLTCFLCGLNWSHLDLLRP